MIVAAQLDVIYRIPEGGWKLMGSDQKISAGD